MQLSSCLLYVHVHKMLFLTYCCRFCLYRIFVCRRLFLFNNIFTGVPVAWTLAKIFKMIFSGVYILLYSKSTLGIV